MERMVKAGTVTSLLADERILLLRRMPAVLLLLFPSLLAVDRPQPLDPACIPPAWRMVEDRIRRSIADLPTFELPRLRHC